MRNGKGKEMIRFQSNFKDHFRQLLMFLVVTKRIQKTIALFDHVKVRSLSKHQIEFDNLFDNRVVPIIIPFLLLRA